MIALCILGGLALLILLVLLLPVGVRVDYSEEGFFLWAVVGYVRVQLMPKKSPKRLQPKQKKSKQGGKRLRKEDRPKTAKKPDKKKDKPKENEKQPGKLTLLLDYLNPILKALGCLRRKLRVKTLAAEYVIGGADDPAKAAVRYGIVSAGGGTLIPAVNQAVNVDNWDVHLSVDFDASETRVALTAQASCRVIQLIQICIVFIQQAMPVYRAQQGQTKTSEEEHKHGRKASDR